MGQNKPKKPEPIRVGSSMAGEMGVKKHYDLCHHIDYDVAFVMENAVNMSGMQNTNLCGPCHPFDAVVLHTAFGKVEP